jgi:hypothetical protein
MPRKNLNCGREEVARISREQCSFREKEMKRVKEFIKTVIIITGVTTIMLVVVFAGGEYWARKTAIERVFGDDTINPQNQTFAYHPWAGFRSTPGFEYQLGNLKYVKINKYGWRGPEPAIERSKNVKRAILLGDSVPFSGWGCREGVTMGAALRRALELRTGDEWEVINTATPAGFSSMSLATLAHEGMQFKPDIVVSLNGANDLLILTPGFYWIYINQEGDTFKHVIYHRIQQKLGKIYDPRTGHYDQSIIIDQVVSHSELLKRIKKYIDEYRRQPPSSVPTHVAGQANPLVPSRDGLERLDHYIDNELAMSYLATGAGVPFIAFLQPYLSLQHKVVGGDIDRALIKEMNDGMPALLPWLDAVYPALREKLAAAAASHPSLQFVDLSLMFTNEQVFADNAHMRCEDNGLSMPGNEMIAARMADAMVSRVYQGTTLPDWRKTHIEGTPHDWNDQAYLDANPEVAQLVAEGKFRNGYAHYTKIGFLKGLHSGFPSWDEKAYLADNPDVAKAVAVGTFASGFDHYLKVGRAEGRLKGLPPRWVEGSYLWRHGDVLQAIERGDFKSGLDHYTRAGAKEGRNGGFSGWDEEGYLFANGDVRSALEKGTFTSGVDHYFRAGAAEGRPIRLGTYTPRE